MFRQLSENERELVRATLARSRLFAAAATDASAAARFREIIARQVRLLQLRAGEVACRAGDYGSEIYLVLEGSLREVVRDPKGVVSLPDPEVRLSAGPKRRFWQRPRPRDEDILIVDANVRRMIDSDNINIEQNIGQKIEQVLDQAQTTLLDDSEATAVGTFAILTRSAFPRTVFAETPARLVAMHWRAARDLIMLSEPVRRAVSARCRDEVLDLVQSGQFVIPAFSSIPEMEALHLIEGADFRFLRGASSDLTAWRQGERLSEALAVVSGIARLRHAQSGRSRSIGFARRGDLVGLAALAAGPGENPASPITLDFMGESSVLAFHSANVRERCLPYLSSDDIARSDPAACVSARTTFSELKNRSQAAPMLDFLLDNAFVRGRQTMVIDQTRCVGCDACVEACADTHGGTPRFVRQGPSSGGFAIANACMHCEEAPCLVNCPTDAIFRKFSGEVVVSEVLCVGCGTCAAACPYDNIRLVENVEDIESIEVGSGRDELQYSTPVAMKCDLCIDERGGPACVRACPHDALNRVDLADSELATGLAR